MYIQLITIIEEDICTFIVVLFAGIPLRACRYAGLSGLIIHHHHFEQASTVVRLREICNITAGDGGLEIANDDTSK